MKNVLFILTGILLTGMVLEGCKKGEGDPGISLRSRKGRMTGEWKVSAGSTTHATATSGSNVSTTTTYDGTNAVSVNTVNGTAAPATTSGYTASLKIEKDGTFEKSETSIVNTTTTTTATKGKWNFLSGIGEFKNKEAVSFLVESVSTTTGSTTTVSSYTGEDRPNVVYMIHTLKNKELILKHDYTDSNGTSTDTHTEEWTLIQ